MKKTLACLLVAATAVLAQVQQQQSPSAVAWTNVGPGGGGWIQSIAASLFDADELFVGCDVGGFYRSTDGGKSYRVYNTGLQDYFVEVIAPHPADPALIFLGCRSGVYRSRDRGRRWQWLREGFPAINEHGWSAPISAISFVPGKPQVVYAAIGDPRGDKHFRSEIYRSLDGGDSWSQIVPAGQLPEKCNITALQIDPRNDQRLLIASSRGVFISADGGASWQESNDGLPAHRRARRMVMAPSNPDVIYLSMRAGSGETPWQGGVYRSDDGGRSWQARSAGLPDRAAPKASDTVMLTCNVDRLQVDPRDADKVWAGGYAWVNATVYLSRDGGRNWQAVLRNTRDENSNYQPGWINFWGPSVTCLTLSPVKPDRLYFGTSGHVICTDDDGGSWEQRYCRQFDDGRIAGTGLEVTCLHNVMPHPRIADKVFFGYFDIGLLWTEDGGQSFRRSLKGIPGSHQNSCFAMVFDCRDDARAWGVFGSWGGRGSGIMAETRDGGQSWTPLNRENSGLGDDKPGNLTALPGADGGTVLYLTQASKGLLCSTDGGQSWQPRNAGLPETGIRLFAAHPTTAGKMICIFSAGKDREPAAYLSLDSGQSWAKAGDMPCSDLKRIVVASDGVIYVVARVSRNHQGGLYASRDDGKTWQKLFANKFAQGLAVDPRNPRRLVIGLVDHPYHDQSTGDGVYLSNDGGGTWQCLNNEKLHNLSAGSIAFDPQRPNKLWVGTGGNGLFYAIIE